MTDLAQQSLPDAAPKAGKMGADVEETWEPHSATWGVAKGFRTVFGGMFGDLLGVSRLGFSSDTSWTTCCRLAEARSLC